MKTATKKVIQNPMRPAVKGLDERQNTTANNQLTEGQLLFRLQDFYGAEQDAAKIGDHEYAQECADIVCVIREVLERRKGNSSELKIAELVNKFYERYPLDTFKNDSERAEALGYFMAGAELQCFGEFIKYEELCSDE